MRGFQIGQIESIGNETSNAFVASVMRKRPGLPRTMKREAVVAVLPSNGNSHHHAVLR